jgi:hypothetical protein
MPFHAGPTRILPLTALSGRQLETVYEDMTTHLACLRQRIPRGATVGLLVVVLSVSCRRGPTQPTTTLSLLAVTPAEISSHESRTVVLNGTGFRTGTTVTFGDLPGIVIRTSDRLLYVTTPSAPPGRVAITLTNPDGQAATFEDRFHFLDFSVKTIGPSSGVAYDYVSIAGAGFVPGTRVLFDGEGVVINRSPSFISVLALPRPPGPIDVTVIAPDGRTVALPAAFTYQEVKLTVNTPTVDRGGRLTVSWNCPCSHFGIDDGGDLLRLYRIGGPDAHVVWDSAVWSPTGTLALTAPTVPGDYEFRYIVWQGHPIATVRVTVTDGER